MAKAKPIPGLRADTPFAQAAAITLRVRSAELFEHAVGVLDTDEIERVHAMRVASRRLRAALELYAPCFPRDQWRAVLRDVKRIADALGARRDPDVQVEGLERFAAVLPEADRRGILRFMTSIRAEQRAGNVVLAEALERLERDGLADRLAALADAADPAESPAEADDAGETLVADDSDTSAPTEASA